MQTGGPWKQWRSDGNTSPKRQRVHPKVDFTFHVKSADRATNFEYLRTIIREIKSVQCQLPQSNESVSLTLVPHSACLRRNVKATFDNQARRRAGQGVRLPLHSPVAILPMARFVIKLPIALSFVIHRPGSYREHARATGSDNSTPQRADVTH